MAEQFEEPIEEIPHPKVTTNRPPSSLTSLSIALTFYRQWEIERARLHEIINKQQREIEKRDNHITELEAKIDTITSMVPELIQCRAPPRVYTLHLKEQYLNFKLNHIIRDLSLSLDTPKEFYDPYQTSPIVVKNLLCKFYLHNYAVTFDSEWNPLLYISDIHIKALMSWVENEIGMGTQAKAYRNLKFDCPLPLRAEAKDPQLLHYDWQKLLARLDVRSQVLPMREEIFQAYEHLIANESTTTVDCLIQHWNNLPDDLKQGEPHSLLNFHAAINRAPKYIYLGRMKNNDWLPLIFQPPILMWPLLGCKISNKPYEVATKEARWAILEKMKGFYWNLASGGTSQGTIGDLRISA